MFSQMHVSNDELVEGHVNDKPFLPNHIFCLITHGTKVGSGWIDLHLLLGNLDPFFVLLLLEDQPCHSVGGKHGNNQPKEYSLIYALEV